MPTLGVGARVFNYKLYGTKEKFFMVLSSEIPASCISNLEDNKTTHKNKAQYFIYLTKTMKTETQYVVNYQELSEIV